jgi:cyclase
VVIAIDAKRASAAVEAPGSASPTCEAPPGWFGDGAWDVYVNGGRNLAEGRDAVGWAREAAERGAGEVLLTSMDRDGTNDGYDLELTKAVSEAVPVPVIASGGAGELEHLATAISEGGADAVLCASIFHYGAYRVRDAKQHLAEQGIAVRL